MKKLVENLKELPNPSYIIDESLFEENLKTLSFIEKASGASVLCALKGFAMWKMFPLLNQYISGGTASSLHEAMLISEEMNTKAHCCFVVYDEEDYSKVCDISSHITFNSLSQYLNFKDDLKSGVQYALRINPEYSNVPFDKYNPCMPGSRFGITAEELPDELPKGITGLHFHTLCESSAEDLELTLTVIEEKFGHLLHQAKWINLGGGHHITKKGYDIELLIELLSQLKMNYGLEVFIEPGEAIGWETGFLLSKVEDVVNNGETAILNVSFAAHMPDCLEMPYKPSVYNEVQNGFDVTLGGNTCMSGDFVKGFKFKEPLKKGDLILFNDMVHYTFVKSTTFNGVKHPALGVWKKDNQFELVRSFTYEDFKNKLS